MMTWCSFLEPSLLIDIEADDALDRCTLWTRGRDEIFLLPYSSLR